MANELVLILIGFCVGVFSGLVGIGGGILIVPSLLFIHPMLTGRPPQTMQAITAISAVQGIAASISSSFIHHRKGNLNFRVVLLLACATVVGSFPGGLTTSWYTDEQIRWVYIGTLVLIIGLSIFDHLRKRGRAALTEGVSGETPLKNVPLSMGIGLGIGYLSGLLGIGGGVLLVPLMYNLMGLPLRTAIGCSTGIVFLTGIGSVAGKASSSGVDLPAALMISAGAICGGFVGAKLSSKFSEGVLFWTLIAIMTFTLIRMLGG